MTHSCEHNMAKVYMEDHSRLGARGKRFWTCSACGRESRWSEGWAWLGVFECRCCLRAIIERVTCPACATPAAKAARR